MMRRGTLLAATLAGLIALCVFAAPAYAPPVIIAVAVYAATGVAAYAALAAIAVTVLTSFLSQPSRPDQPSGGGGAAAPNGNPAITVRQPAAPRQMIFGRWRTGGVYSFLHTTGSDNSTLHMVVTLSGHPVQSIEAVCLADQVLFLGPTGICESSGPLVPVLNPDANAAAPPDFSGKVTCIFGLGTTSSDALFMSTLKANLPDKWTDDHRQSGCAKAYLKLTFDRNVFPGGIPNPSFLVTGYKNVEDPRGATGWTDNAALCIAQYFRDQQLALGYGSSEIDDDALIAAANSCDEMVPRGGPFAFTADAASNKLTFTGGGGFRSGQPLYFINSGGGLPGGLAAATCYYWIADVDDPKVGQVSASTVTGGQPGAAVDITSTGSGTNTAVIKTSFTVVTTSGILTVADLGSSLRCGTRLTVEANGNPLTLGLSEGVEYFWIPITLTTGHVAASLADARAGTRIGFFGGDRPGPFLLTVDAEPRYTLNGVIDTSKDAHSIVPDLLSAMAGTKADSGGKVSLYAGVWQGSGPVFVETMLDAGVQTAHRRSRRDVFNGQKGTFFNPDNGFQSTDYPAVQVAAYVTEDSGLTLWKDAQLPFTNSPTACQRISRIAVEKVRRQISVTLALKLHGLQARAGENFGITNTKRGWNGKTFECQRWGFADRTASNGGAGEDEGPRLGIDVQGQEIDANCFRWTSAVDELAMRPAPTTSLPSAFSIVAPSALVLTSDATTVLMFGQSAIPRIKVAWTSPADLFALDIEVQFKLASSADWLAGGLPHADAAYTFIDNVLLGTTYNVRIRTVRRLGVASAWVTGSITTAALEPTAPGPPTVTEALYVTRDGAGVKTLADLAWADSPDALLREYEAQYRLHGATDWTSLARTSNTTAEILDLAAGVYEFRVAAINTLGVFGYSATVTKEIIGLGAPPSALTGFNLNAAGGFALGRWDQSPDIDVRIGGHLEVRWSPAFSGATGEESVSIGNALPGIATTFTLPLKAGTYLIRAVDSSGIAGPFASFSTKQATSLTYANLSTITESPAFAGVKSGTIVSGGLLQLAGAGLVDAIPNIDTVVDWDTAGGVTLAGTYSFAAGFDFGSVVRKRLTSSITAQVINPLDLIDSRTELIDDWDDFDGTASVVGDAQVWVRSTDDDPAGSPTWTAYQRLDSAEFFARGHQFETRLSTLDPAFNIQISALSVAAEDVA